MPCSLLFAVIIALAMATNSSAIELPKQVPAESRARSQICLNGDWDFQIQGSDEWVRVRVPGSYTGVRRTWGRQYWDIWDYPIEWQGRGGTYRRYFELPQSMQDKNVTFYCGGARHHSRVVVNGTEFGSFNEAYEPFEFDITDALKLGGNELRVIIEDKGNDLSEDYCTNLRGIDQDTFLKSYSDLRIDDDAFLITSVEDKSLTYHLPVSNYTGEKIRFFIRNYITDAEGRQVKMFDGGRWELTGGGEEVLTVGADWSDPHLWFPHDPYLYHIHTVLYGEDGRPVEHKKLRFGFREITTDGPHLYINGRELRLRGHGGHRLGDIQGGHAYSEAWLRGLKKRGINFLRLHNSARHQSLYRVADEIGIILEAEASFHFILPESEDRAKLHARRMVKYLRNHPSVAMWSVCNEVHWRGYEEPKYLIDLCHKLDPTRPAFASGFSYASKHGDIISHHYSRDTVFEDWEKYGPDKPMVWDEMSNIWQHDRPLKNGSAGYEVTSQDYTTGLWRDAHDETLASINIMRGGKMIDGTLHRVSGFVPWDLSYNYFRWQPFNNFQILQCQYDRIDGRKGMKPAKIKPCSSPVNIWDPTLPTMEPNPGYYILQKHLKAVRFFDESDETTFFCGDTVALTGKLYYDDTRPADELACRVETRDGMLLTERKIPVDIKPGDIRQSVTARFDMPEVKTATPINIVRQFNHDGQAGYRHTIRAKVFPRLQAGHVPAMQGKTLAVDDPFWKEYLQDRGFRVGDPQNADVLIMTGPTGEYEEFVVHGGRILRMNGARAAGAADEITGDTMERFDEISEPVNLCRSTHESSGTGFVWRGWSPKPEHAKFTIQREGDAAVLKYRGNGLPGAYVFLQTPADGRNAYIDARRKCRLKIHYKMWTPGGRNKSQRMFRNGKGALFRKVVRPLIRDGDDNWFIAGVEDAIVFSKPGGRHNNVIIENIDLRAIEWQRLAGTGRELTGKVELEGADAPPDLCQVTALGLYIHCDNSEHVEFNIYRVGISARPPAAARIPLNGPNHRLLAGVDQRDLAHWRGGSATTIINLPDGSQNFRTILHGNKDGHGAALCEKFEGEGVVLESALNIRDTLNNEPVAGWMLRNMLQYLADYRTTQEPTDTAYIGGQGLEKYLQDIGLLMERIDARNGLDLDRFRTAVIDGSDRRQMQALQGRPEALRQFVKNGGRVMVCGTSESTLGALRKLTGRNLQLTEPFLGERKHCIKAAISWTRRHTPDTPIEYYDGILIPQPFEPNYDPLIYGIANRDLYWNGQKMFDRGIEIDGMNPVAPSREYNILITNWRIDYSQPHNHLYGEYTHAVKDMRRASWFVNRDPVVLKINDGDGFYILNQLNLPVTDTKGRRIAGQLLTAMGCSLGQRAALASVRWTFDMSAPERQIRRFAEYETEIESTERQFYGTPEPLLDYWKGTKAAGEAAGAAQPSILLLGNDVTADYAPFVKQQLAAQYGVQWSAQKFGNSRQALERLDEMVGDRQWSIVQFSTGIADLKKDERGEPAVALDEYRDNLTKIGRQLQKAANKVYFVPALPRPTDHDEYRSELIDEYNAAATEVLEDQNLYINNLHAFVEHQMPAAADRPPAQYTDGQLKRIANQVSRALVTFGAQALAGIEYKHGWQPGTGKFGTAVHDVLNGDWFEYDIDVPEAGQYILWTRYAVSGDGRSGKFLLRVNDGQRMPLEHLPDTGGWHKFQWKRQTELKLKKGENRLRWEARMGGINFDAFLLTDADDYTPEGTELDLPEGSILFHAEEFRRSLNEHADIR